MPSSISARCVSSSAARARAGMTRQRRAATFSAKAKAAPAEYSIERRYRHSNVSNGKSVQISFNNLLTINKKKSEILRRRFYNSLNSNSRQSCSPLKVDYGRREPRGILLRTARRDSSAAHASSTCSRMLTSAVAPRLGIDRHGADARLELTKLFSHPNIQVRTNAAKRSLGIARESALNVLRQIMAEDFGPFRLHAGMTVALVEDGTIAPT